jgi:peptide/nickel transport system ATP-binding protein
MIRIRDLTLSHADRTILQGVSFDIAIGETFALVGESGGGKTSIGRLLLGQIDGQPPGASKPSSPRFHWSGEVRVDGVDMLAATPADLCQLRGRRIGLIVQALSDALNPHLTVIQHMQEILTINGLHAVDAARTCLAYDIGSHLHHRLPAGLSGGEIQRLLAALALVPRPNYLVLDEPTAALDEASRARAIRACMHGRDERAQLLITHDLDLARMLATRIGVLHRGRIVETGRPVDVLANPTHHYTRAFVDTVNHLRPEDDHSESVPSARADASGFGGKLSPAPEASAQEGLIVSDLSHAINGRPVVHDISFSVAAGSCLAVMGTSGGGKSTLARLLTGFEPLQSGTISWQPATDKDCAAIAMSALISQHPHRAMNPYFTVNDVLQEVFRLRYASQPAADDIRSPETHIAALLDRVGLPAYADFRSRRTAFLSGGEAQRLVIARALAANPRYLVADEPTSALDPLARGHVLSLLADLKRQTGMALVVFTHDPTVADYLGDRQLLLENGGLREHAAAHAKTSARWHRPTSAA